MSSPGILAGRLALVTGSGSGIGRAVCQVLVKEGARIAAVDVNSSGAAETVTHLTGDHYSFATDVSCPTAVKDMLAEVKDKFRQVPCINVNAAGITRDKFLLKMDEKSFDDVINVNLKGTFLVTQAVAQAMVEAKVQTGSIVNIASIVAKAGNIGQANYAASKSGLIGMTKTAAQELARNGIRCNVILPGFIQTPMTDAVPSKVMDKVLRMVPMNRIGSPDEIAEACLFLASPKSSYITGATLEVTGGLHM